MKNYIYLITLIFICEISSGEEVTLMPNSPVSYVFSDLVPTSETISGSYSVKIRISYGSDGLLENEGYTTRFYSNVDSADPFYTGNHIWSYTAKTSSSVSYYDIYGTDVWRSALEGRIEVEHLSGDFSISSIKIVLKDVNGNYYTQTMTAPTEIPVATTNGTPYIWLYELGYNSDWESADLEDLDSDGFFNWQEYVADTDPTNNLDYLELKISEGTLSFNGSSSCVYSISHCDTLNNRNWEILTNNIIGSGDVMSITLSLTNPANYFRITAERTLE